MIKKKYPANKPVVAAIDRERLRFLGSVFLS